MTPDIIGTCDSRFKAVSGAFRETFSSPEPYRNVGAALCVYVRGRCVIDLHGGAAGHDKAWSGDTLVNIWSATKGIVAIAVAMLVDEGRLSYDAPIAKYWPEFAQSGKEHITVAQVMSHQAGLNGFVEPTMVDDLYDWSRVTSHLAAQEPFWRPGEATAYHALTYGFLAGELVRRASGQSIGSFLAARLSGPLKADVFIGVPESERVRIARILPPIGYRSLADGMSPLARRAVTNPSLQAELPNDPRWIAGELPAVNGHASAAGLGKIYGALANGGHLGSVRLLSLGTIERMCEPLSSRPDLMLGARTWAAGVVVNTEGNYGPNKFAFGHSGWGGSFGCADLERGIGIGYVHNQMGPNVVGDPRGISLCAAAYDCLER
jgi:CubicO group peptidase (beta-lactamase class C family)